MTVFINLRAQAVGGDTAAEARLLCTNNPKYTANDFEQLIAGHDVLFAAHGFNVDQSDGITSLSCWEQRMTLPESTVFVGILWPGDSAWVPVLDYPWEGHAATMSGIRLATFLNEHISDAASIDFVSHSLGARTVLEAISCLGPRVRRLILMAGAIDNTCLSDAFQNAAQRVQAISILASRGDWVLEFAFPAGNFVEGILDRDNPYTHPALGRAGPAKPDPANVKPPWQIPDAWDYGHLDYMPHQPGVKEPVPIRIPPHPQSQAPSVPPDKASWSAGFVSTRLL